MLRFALLLVATVLLHSTFCVGSDFDAVTHQAAPPAQTNWHGREEKLAGLDVYATGSPSSSKAIIFISDIYGWEAPLFRKLADKVAANGYYVVAPDFFLGDPLASPANFSTWIVRHAPADSVEPAKAVVKALNDAGIHSVGIAGFCWGSKVAALVGKKKGFVNAIVQAHPSLVEASDYEEFAVPFAVLAAPSDGIDQFKSLLKARRKDLKLYVKIFTQVQHGWTIRYDENDKKAVKKANRAHRLLLKWFHKYV